MNTVTTELLDARIETIEARLDARVLAIEATVVEIRADIREIRAEIKSLRVTIVVTAIASVLAIASINAAMYSNMLAAFESRKDIAKTQAEVTRQVEATAALLKRIEEQAQRSERRN
ncbi:hypothetical protein [Duganella radicis]|uniref:Uncharacterized protein n=1 Tax=Duganella radicis TaxID=551988 RepID=A0A6L6PCR1_9BURK|nr:hypothetical protein [Duganella radicis]MTV36165.1 hypothetical protein [Duganella radicis]